MPIKNIELFQEFNKKWAVADGISIGVGLTTIKNRLFDQKSQKIAQKETESNQNSNGKDRAEIKSSIYS